MIQLTAHMRVLVSVAPVDFRRGIDGLAALCRAGLGQDPFGGTVFLFCNRRLCSAEHNLRYAQHRVMCSARSTA